MGNQVPTDNFATVGPNWMIPTAAPCEISIPVQKLNKLNIQELRAFLYEKDLNRAGGVQVLNVLIFVLGKH